MSNQDVLDKRDKLYAEVTHLENEQKKIEAALKTKREELRRICPCNERTGGFEYSYCKHCGEMH